MESTGEASEALVRASATADTSAEMQLEPLEEPVEVLEPVTLRASEDLRRRLFTLSSVDSANLATSVLLGPEAPGTKEP